MFTQSRQIDVVQFPNSKADQIVGLSHLGGTEY
jgi:hypothetical protein